MLIESLETRTVLSVVTVGPDLALTPWAYTVQGVSGAVASNGSSVVVWSDRDSIGLGGDIFMRRFDAAGQPLNRQVLVNDITTGAQMNPDVAIDPSTGSIAVVYQSRSGSTWDVFLRLFNPDGSVRSSSIQVNASDVGQQVEPAVAFVGSNVVVAWLDQDDDGVNSVAARRVDATGALVGTQVRASPTDAVDGIFTHVGVALTSNGIFAVTWGFSDANDSYQSDIQTRVFDAADAPISTIQRINQVTEGDQIQPSIAGDGTRFALTWISLAEGDAGGVSTRLLAPNGLPVGDEIVVSQDSVGQPNRSQVSFDSRGNFAVGWTLQDTLSNRTLVRWFDADRNPTGDESITGEGVNRTLHELMLSSDGRAIELTTQGGEGFGAGAIRRVGNILDLTASDASNVINLIDRGTAGFSVVIDGVSRDASAGLYHGIRIDARGGNDRIDFSQTTSLSAYALGGAGNDTVITGAGDDSIDGGAGDDQITLNAGRDYAFGGDDNDTIDGGTGNDILSGGAQRNLILGGDGDDRLNGGGGRDTLRGNAGSDRLFGNGGADQLDGGEDIDRLWAGDGDDVLIGGSGNDKLYGDAGNDTLTGSRGTDFFSGGIGTDTALDWVAPEGRLSIEIG